MENSLSSYFKYCLLARLGFVLELESWLKRILPFRSTDFYGLVSIFKICFQSWQCIRSKLSQTQWLETTRMCWGFGGQQFEVGLRVSRCRQSHIHFKGSRGGEECPYLFHLLQDQPLHLSQLLRCLSSLPLSLIRTLTMTLAHLDNPK